MPNLYTLGDVVARMKLVMEYFDNNVTKFSIHLGEYLWKYLRTYKPQLFLEYHPEQQTKQGEKKKEESKSKTTDMKSETAAIGDSKTKEMEDMFKTLSSAFASGTLANLIELLKAVEGGGKFMENGGLEDAQRFRRASALDAISKQITSESGKKMSSVEKNSIVVEEAKKIADIEQKEDDVIEADDGLIDEFKAGDEVIIIEGENCGLFGTLQYSTLGIFGVFDSSIKEDEEGNYGVDIHMPNGQDEGYWIHPEAMQLKRYVAGQEVKVIDGLNKGRFGTIQSDGPRLRMDEGSYGVDVKMDDGSIEGFWVYPTSLVHVKEIEKVDEKDEDLDVIDKYEFLPYEPFPGDVLDENLADQLNTFEIDINIKRLVAKSGKVIYRFGGKRHLVRFIHGILLVKREKEGWVELIPVLRKLCGKNKVQTDIFSKK